MLAETSQFSAYDFIMEELLMAVKVPQSPPFETMLVFNIFTLFTLAFGLSIGIIPPAIPFYATIFAFSKTQL